jgi:hypothetical protein
MADIVLSCSKRSEIKLLLVPRSLGLNTSSDFDDVSSLFARFQGRLNFAVTKTFGKFPSFHHTMAPSDKKRPRGLKGVAAQKAAKKSKTEIDDDKTQTVILDKEVEEGDELGEVTALYESAKEKSGMYRLLIFFFFLWPSTRTVDFHELCLSKYSNLNSM